jgi:glutamine cyclotransferase
MRKLLYLLLLLGFLSHPAPGYGENPSSETEPFESCGSPTPSPPVPESAVEQGTPPRIPVYTYKIVHAYPHDRNAFTQGLVFERDALYEGTGLYGRSTVRRVELTTGKIVQIYKLPDRFFGEGITIDGNTIVQLTWRAHVGFVYDKSSLRPLRRFSYPTEGWGITHDGRRLIMSDGTATLYFLDPETFEETGRTHVSDNMGPVANLNELEYIRGEVYANVWQTDRIVKIAPETGQVTGWIDLEGLSTGDTDHARADILNGIAYDAKNNRLFVTGKLWSRLFEIQLIPLIP